MTRIATWPFPMARILVVDDEARIREVVQYALAREGHQVESVPDGEKALARLGRSGIDLVILDVLMPELDGLSVCRRMRADPALANVPVIFLSSRGEEADKVNGLELGGDDYLAKPFSPRELASRVKAVLRRAAGASPHAPADGGVRTHGGLEIDVPRHEVRVHGNRVELTATEFGVLLALYEAPGRVLTRGQLIDRAYSHDNVITERTIDTHVRRIRSKLRAHGLDPIETVHGVGYKASIVEG